MLEVQNISVNLGGVEVVRDVSFRISKSDNVAIIGPNGCGKSTLLRCIIGSIPAETGRIYFQGEDFSRLPLKQRAKTIGLLSQKESVPSMTSVFDYVCAGRHPYRKFLRGLDHIDLEVVDRVLEELDIAHLRDRVVERLSGGERQRVRLATLMAQDPQVLLLDEPMTGLDLCHQYLLLKVLSATQKKFSKASISVMHDIDMALRFFSRLLIMKEGRVVADGPPQEVLTDTLIQEVFGVRGKIQTHTESCFPLFICDPFQDQNCYDKIQSHASHSGGTSLDLG